MKTPLKTTTPKRSLLPLALPLLGAALLHSACDQDGPVSEPVALAVTPLSGTSCGDPNSPTPGPNPFSEVSSISVAVRAWDSTTSLWSTLVKSSQSLREGQAVKLARVPEGTGRDVIVFAQGAGKSWYGRDTGVAVKRNSDNAAAMVLTRFGGFSCVPTPTDIVNTTFPSAVTLGDGRILVTGGFTDVSSDGGGTKLTAASNQAFLFDPRTGATEVLPNLGVNQGRAGHTSVFLPSKNRVLILGGMTELTLDESKPFPWVYDPARGRDDYVIFDVATKTFTAGTDRMTAKRGFPRAALLADGTVIITGGGKWPFDPAGTDQIQVDMFDPEDDDGQGGLLDIPPLRTFYWRAGHSLTLLDQAGGLSTLLLWGGTTPDRSLGHPAEIFRQSGRQRDGVNGTFIEVQITGEASPFSYFHETTRLSGGRFLVTGGSRFANGQLQAPEADDAWLLTYSELPTPKLQAKKVPGFGAGRVFHTALSDDLQKVALVGGWGPIDAAAQQVASFDLATSTWTAQDAAAALTAGRGGHAAVLTPAGTVFLVGGEASARTAPGTTRLTAEIYTPSTAPVP